MNKTEIKILKAIQTNRLNPEILGERIWCNYFLRITELVWSRNLYDGCLVEVYNKDESHLCTLKI
jgi:hypothetical protein